MSYIAIYDKVVIFNNGIYKNNVNKCGIISIGQSTGINSYEYIEIINNMLGLGELEKLDIYRDSAKLQQVCDIFGFTINVHCAKFLNNGLIRVWKSTQCTISSKDQPKSYDIHILWYGDHFEYVNWREIQLFPEYKESVYNLVKQDSHPNAEIFMHFYHSYSQIC